MADELISREAVLKKLSRMIDYCKTDNKVTGLTALFQVADAIMDCPSVDAVEVVRCEYCKWCVDRDETARCGHCICPNRDVFANDTEAFEAVSYDDFCSYGERKEKSLERGMNDG